MLPAYTFSQLLTQDVHQHEAGLKQWEQSYEQLTSGSFVGRYEELQIGCVHVFRETANQTTFQTGAAVAGSLGVALTTSPTRDWYCGHPLTGRQTIATGSGGEFELVAGTGMDLLSVIVVRRRWSSSHTLCTAKHLPRRPSMPR